MNMQVTSRLARLAARLAAIGNRYAQMQSRISTVKARSNPDPIALRVLKRQQKRLEREMKSYEEKLRRDCEALPQ